MRKFFISVFLFFLCNSLVFGASNCTPKLYEIEIDTNPLVGKNILALKRLYTGNEKSAFMFRKVVEGFDIDQISGVLSVSKRISLTEKHDSYLVLDIIERATDFSCPHKVVLHVVSKDIQSWLDKGSNWIADFRKNEYFLNGHFFGSESNFREASGGFFSRDSEKNSLNAGRKVFNFKKNIPAITDRGLLLEGARTQYLLNPDSPSVQEVVLVKGNYILQMWGSGAVKIDGVVTGVAKEHEPFRFSIPKNGIVTVTPLYVQTESKVQKTVRKFQLTNSSSPTTFIPYGSRAGDKLSYNITKGIENGAFLAVFDLDLPPLGNDHAFSFRAIRSDYGSGLIVKFSAQGEIELLLRVNGESSTVIRFDAYKSEFGNRGSRLAIGFDPFKEKTVYVYLDGNIIGQLPIRHPFRLAEIVFGDDLDREKINLDSYLKKLVVLPFVPSSMADTVLGASDRWDLPQTHQAVNTLKLIDPIIVDLEEMEADQVFPGFGTGELLDYKLNWTKTFPIPRRDVLIVGARTKVRKVRNVYGNRGNESAVTIPVNKNDRVDTDVINSIGTVWEIGGYKFTRSVFHNAISGLRAGIYRDMNPLENGRDDWNLVTRNDPHQTRLNWNTRQLKAESYDYYIDLITESVSGTVEGYHGDAGMQWQTASTDGKSSPLGAVADYCGHFNIKFSTYYAGFFLPVQYLSKDVELNESAPLPRWLKISRVQGRMAAEYRQYEKDRPEDIKKSPGNVTSAFYHLDTSDGNRYGSYRPYPVFLKDFYIEPFPGRNLIDHVRPLNGKPIYQFINSKKEIRYDIDGRVASDGGVYFPEVTMISGFIKPGKPSRDYVDSTSEYGPGAWYWPRFEGMIY
ncbi:hypothetical protein [Azonexus sp. R2A61]|uniref:hypothetical protein n=1 Tax=Azonexus sp. R2A61 TaxID=2744443 RepID=UPI001F292DF3|nr:hypothetical protein [Azonexus sp. R2A61]